MRNVLLGRFISGHYRDRARRPRLHRTAYVVQENAAKVYRVATIVGGVLILFLLGLIGYVMTFS